MSPNFDALAWLQDWFVEHCDGQWEGLRGVSVTSTDGPGWFLSIPLQETPLDGRVFKRVDHNRSTDESWWICQVGEGHFLAACGPRDLAAVVGVFRDWAQIRTP